MFNNIGGKLKTLAIVITVLGIIAAIVLGIIMMTQNFLIGLIYMVVLAFFTLIGSFLLYALGHISDTVEDIYYVTKGNSNLLDKIKNSTANPTENKQPLPTSPKSTVAYQTAAKKATPLSPKAQKIKILNNRLMNKEITQEEYAVLLEEINSQFK